MVEGLRNAITCREFLDSQASKWFCLLQCITNTRDGIKEGTLDMADIVDITERKERVLYLRNGYRDLFDSRPV